MLIKYYVKLTIVFEEQNDGQWTASCKELGTSTFGDSLNDAQEKIEEAVFLHLEALVKVGELKRFFEENNISLLNEPQKSGLVAFPQRMGHTRTGERGISRGWPLSPVIGPCSF